jgi:transglutaminase-like putative cysteine protease
MLYDVRHVTTYTYGAPVPFARCVMRIFPRDEAGQKVISTALELKPGADDRRDGVCFFGNKVTTISVERPHRSLTVLVKSRVEVNTGGGPGFGLSPSWESVRAEAMDAASLGAHSPAHFIYSSRLVPLPPDITAYAGASFTPGRPLLDAARELMGRIKRDFKYDPKATVISTPLAQAFEKRAGVCQDFAHVMIAGLRGLGLPAAYVSGYLRTIPPPGQKRLEGADASHAWVAVWGGAAVGWIGLDPTNDLVAAEDHIVIARGRDYADVSPIDGVIIGAGEQSVEVKVDVTPVEG